MKELPARLWGKNYYATRCTNDLIVEDDLNKHFSMLDFYRVEPKYIGEAHAKYHHQLLQLSFRTLCMTTQFWDLKVRMELFRLLFTLEVPCP